VRAPRALVEAARHADREQLETHGARRR